MMLMQRIHAYQALWNLKRKYRRNKKLDRLLAYVDDKREMFDFYICDEFPHGVEDWEFEEFCLEHQDEIFENVK